MSGSRRVGTDRRYDFLINFSDEHREIEVPDDGFELLTGTATKRRITLGPAGVAIIPIPEPRSGTVAFVVLRWFSGEFETIGSVDP